MQEADGSGNVRLERLVRLLRIPENKAKGIVPWFVILRRLIFIPFLYVALGIGWFAIAGAFGFQDANRWVRDAA